MVARSLVNGEIDLFKELLGNPNTKRFQLDLLAKMRGEKWVEFIAAALEAGWSVEDLVSASAALNDGWSGPASQHFKRRMESYAPGLKSSDPRIVKIAQDCTDIYKAWYERELKDEDRESVYGIDG